MTSVHEQPRTSPRLITHDAYHCGEISLTLGSHGLGEIDLSTGLSRIADRPRSTGGYFGSSSSAAELMQ